MEFVLKYFPYLSQSQINQFSLLKKLYHSWNEKINVISRKDIEHLYVRHVLHSLSISKIVHFNPGAKVIDVGTGGGFPGIPLAILFPETKFHLNDSIGKKITVVKEISKELNLSNITAEKARVETIETKFDFIISRAVTAFPKFVALCRNNISTLHNHNIKNGIIYLKGGEFEQEVVQYKNKVRIVRIISVTRYPATRYKTQCPCSIIFE